MLTETLEYLGIAFVSSAALIVMSKIILQHLIRRPADYYSAAEVYQEEVMLSSAGLSITEEHKTDPEGVVTEEEIEADTQVTAEEAMILQTAWQNEEEEVSLPEDLEPVSADDIEELYETEEEEQDLEEPEEQQIEPEVTIIEETKEEPVRESYEDIRRKLQEAYDKTQEPVAASEPEPEPEPVPVPVELAEPEPVTEPEPIASPEPAPEPESVTEPEKEEAPKTKPRRARKPSMKMKKAELVEIAENMGIEIPDKATKQIILDLINAKE